MTAEQIARMKIIDQAERAMGPPPPWDHLRVFGGREDDPETAVPTDIEAWSEAEAWTAGKEDDQADAA